MVVNRYAFKVEIDRLSVLNSKDIEYKSYVLSDIGVIELLIAYRYKYDTYLFSDRGDGWSSPDALPFNEEMILTYATLDNYIEKCSFNEDQLKTLTMIEQGHNYEEIAEELKTTPSSIQGRLNTIYRRIVKENEWQWRKVVYTEKLELKNKRCIKCEEELPATHEFYSPYDKSSDGFFSYCKACRK